MIDLLFVTLKANAFFWPGLRIVRRMTRVARLVLHFTMEPWKFVFLVTVQTNLGRRAVRFMTRFTGLMRRLRRCFLGVTA